MKIRIKDNALPSEVRGRKKKAIMWDYFGYPLSVVTAGGVLASIVNPRISLGVFLSVLPIAVVAYVIRYRYERRWDCLLSQE